MALKNARFILIPLLCLLILSCEKKRYPDSDIEKDAVFYFNAEVDGKPVNLGAGIDGYYMYSSYAKNQGNKFDFRGSLRKTSCEECAEGLQIILNDATTISSVDSVFSVRQYPYRNDSALNVSVRFAAEFNREATSYVWDFGDGVTSSLQTPDHVYERPGIYNVCLTIYSSGGCQSSICNTIDFSPGALRTFVVAKQVGAETIIFSPSVSGSAPFSFQWNFGDGTTGTEAEYQQQYAVPGSYPVVLTVRDSRGRLATATYNVYTAEDKSSCAANFSFDKVLNSTPAVFKTITVVWTDELGRTYNSAGIDQPSDATFEIIEVKDYERNENGEATKQLKLQFSCVVSDGISLIRIRNGRAVIAMSYPE